MGHEETAGHHAHAAAHHNHGHHGHGPLGHGGPLQVLFVNALITQFFARVWMVVSAIALMRIASSLALGARVKAASELRDDLTEEQRAELVDDIWRRVQRKRMCCPAMPACCTPSRAGKSEADAG